MRVGAGKLRVWPCAVAFAVALGCSLRTTAQALPRRELPGVDSLVGCGSGPQLPRKPTYEHSLSSAARWWSFQRDAFEAETSRLETAGTLGCQLSVREIRTQLVPALRKVITEVAASEVDIACALALAKLAPLQEESELLPLLRQHVASPASEVQEVAALALGISGMQGAVADLERLVRADVPVPGAPIGLRTRVFACYGLGLLAGASHADATKQRAAACFLWLLEHEPQLPEELQIAALHGCGLLALDSAAPAQAATHAVVMGALDVRYQRSKSRAATREHAADAHLPLVMAALARGHRRTVTDLVGRFVRDLAAASVPAQVRESVISALGVLTPSVGQLMLTSAVVQALEHEASKPNAGTASGHALVALGRIGDGRCDDYLFARLTAPRPMDHGWAMLALGILQARGRLAVRMQHQARIREALEHVLTRSKSPDRLRHVAITAGLAGLTSSTAAMRGLLVDHPRDDELAASILHALARLEPARSATDARELLTRSARRPAAFDAAAQVLARGSDPAITDELHACFDAECAFDAAPNAMRLARAIGARRDPRSVPMLLRYLLDAKERPAVRAAAATALGHLADRSAMHWSAELAAMLPNTVLPPVLHDGARGILDLD